MPDTAENAAPISRRLALTDVPPEGLEVEIQATPAERAAIAQLNGLPDVFEFTASLKARRWRRDGLEVTGEVRARLRQTCVVSLETFDSEIVEPVDMRFAPAKESVPQSHRRRGAQDEEPAKDMGAELTDLDLPDPLIGGAVDLGAVASEFLTLALDPYPRKPGAQFVEPAPETSGTVSPFAGLGARKTGEGES